MAGERTVPYRILIADESGLSRAAIAKALHRLCFEWPRLEAATANEALAFVHQSAVDVVLLDVAIPGRQGLELLAELRAFRPAMPIALIAGDPQPDVVQGARRLDAACLVKPIDPVALKVFVEHAAAALSSLRA
jgi:CheY-like chemotaxis protein